MLIRKSWSTLNKSKIDNCLVGQSENKLKKGEVRTAEYLEQNVQMQLVLFSHKFKT